MIGERLKAARRARGFTQRDLAERGHVSAMAISKYERDQDVPGSGVLLRLARALDQKVDYFFRPISVELTEPMYRCRPNFSRRQREELQHQVQEWLERYLEAEALVSVEQSLSFTLPSLRDRTAQSMDEVEQVAERLRTFWKLGLLNPIENLAGLLEDQGIKVGIMDGPDEWDACVMWAGENLPVVVTRRALPGDRQRLSLAHELSHLVLVPTGELDEESAAYRFAGAFLVPAEAAFKELGHRRDALHPRELYLLKHKYGLSMSGWIHRAKQLGILDEAKANHLFREFRDRGWDRKEPGNQLSSEKPPRLEQLVAHLRAEGVISESRATELLGRPLEESWQEEPTRHDAAPLVVRH